MASIPLVALNVKPPAQQPDLLDRFSQLQQLRASQQQQAMQQQEAPVRQQILGQQAQSGQLQLQQQQAAIQNQQAVTSAYRQWDGKSYEDLAHLALKGGATGEAVQSIQQHGLALRKTASDIAEQDAKTGSDNATTLGKQLDQAAGSLNGVLSAPPDQQSQLLLSTAQQLAQQKRPDGTPLLDARHLQMAQQLAQQGPQAIATAIPAFAKSLTAFSAQLDAAQKQATTAKDIDEPIQAAANAAETAKRDATEAKQGQQRISIEGARLAFDKNRQGTQDTQAIESQAQQIASGDVKGLSQARNNPFAKAVMARVYEINPKYSDSLYTATQDLRSSKPNSSGANVGRLGTAILHADNALKESNNLGFSEGLMTGIPTAGTAAYKQASEFLTGEIGQYVTGGKLTVDEGKKLSGDLMSSRQGVRDSALHKIIDLSGGKLKSQMEQYTNATQNPFPTDRVFNDPDIKGALVNHGVLGGGSASSGMVTVQIPGSPTGQIPAAAVAKFKADHPNAVVQ